MLLQFVARELGGTRLLLIGTYRDMELSRQHPLAEALGELTRERLFQRVLLRGLNQEDVRRFIEIAAGVTPPSALVDSVYTQTEGNPLFVTEVVRLLVQEGELSPEKVRETGSWTIRIPEGVREVIGRRLNRLSQRCNEALTSASILGREFTIAQLRPLVEEVTEDRLFEVLEEALGARVIEELPQSVGRYQFTHALIQETLTTELSLTRRVRLHARIAETLEELYIDDAKSHAAELAYHFAQAESLLGTEKLVRYSLAAGEKELISYAWEEAQAHFEQGLAARGIPIGGTDPAPDSECAGLLFGYGRCRASTGQRPQMREAVDILARAFDYYVENGEVPTAVAVASYTVPMGTARIGMGRIIRTALSLVPGNSLEAGRLLSGLGYDAGRVAGDYEQATKAFAQALSIARSEVQTLTYAASVSAEQLRWQESVENGLRAIELATGDENPFSDLVSRFWTALSLLAIGDLDRARLHALVMRDLVERRSNSRLLASDNFSVITSLSCLDGDWKAGREYSARGLELSPLNPRLLEVRVLLEYQTGGFDQGEVYLETRTETPILPKPSFSQRRLSM